MGLYQVSANNSPGVKFDPTPGVTSFKWADIGKTLEFSLHVAMRHRSTKSAQGIALGSNLALPRGLQVLHWLIEGKIAKSPCILPQGLGLPNCACSFI